MAWMMEIKVEDCPNITLHRGKVFDLGIPNVKFSPYVKLIRKGWQGAEHSKKCNKLEGRVRVHTYETTKTRSRGQGEKKNAAGSDAGAR